MAEEANETQEETSGGGMGKKLMLAGIGVGLLGAGVFAGMTFLGGEAPAEGEEVAEEGRGRIGNGLRAGGRERHADPVGDEQGHLRQERLHRRALAEVDPEAAAPEEVGVVGPLQGGKDLFGQLGHASGSQRSRAAQRGSSIWHWAARMMER